MRFRTGGTLGRYTIQEIVGHGGMATVYRASDPLLQRDVAIKVPHDFLAEDRSFRERFVREAATVARLRHPNIVTVFDYGEEDGTPYIVTEHVSGGTLAARLSKPLAVGETIAILRPLAAALDYAHGRGILHRDVKPSNIMFEENGTPVLTDFGLARISGSLPPLTRTGESVGTAEYMAPEIARGEVTTPSVDRYALAVIAFEMITGRVPFTGHSPLATLLAHRDNAPPRPREINPAVSPDVEDVLVRALEKQAEDRYASAVEFIEALAIADDRSKMPAPAERRQPPVPSRAAGAGPVSAEAGTPPPGYGAVMRGRTLGVDFDWPADSRSTRTLAILEAVQHPLALLPIAAGSLALIYLLFLAPSLGYVIPALAAVVAALASAAVAVKLRYPMEYANAQIRTEDMRERKRQERELQDLARVHEALDQGFSSISAEDGRKALVALTTEFQQLRPALSRRETDPLSIALVSPLSIEAYREGLSALSEAQGLAKEIHTSAPDRLRAEVAALDREIDVLKPDPANLERLRMKEESREEQMDILRRLERLELSKEQLLHAARHTASSLHGTRIDLAEIRTGSSKSSIDAVIFALRKAIDQTREIQDEIRKLGGFE